MRNKVAIFLLAVLFSFSITASATHIYGGELLYQYLSGNSYKISLTLYGDCSANPTTFNQLYSATPSIDISNDAGHYQTTTLALESNGGYEVTPICSSEISNSACNGGILPGIKKFVYNATVQLNGSFANWKFVFAGGLGTQTSAGRSSNITNIVNGGNSLMYLEATLNNTTGANSSPQYTSLPTPFYCINTAEQYNQGAVDPNNDSLSFSLTPALVANGTVTYIAPYSATQPLATTPGSFSFNGINGQMSFTPSQQQDALVVNKVFEYKNGVLVGTSMREMTFIVFATCNNHPPVGNVNSSSISGGVPLGNNIVGVCQGGTTVSFNIQPTDPDGDTINMSWTGVPPGATVTAQNNNTPAPTLNFSWNTAGVPVGIYNFFVTYKDNGCPLSSQQTLAYTLQVVNHPDYTMQILAPTGCAHPAYVKLNVTDGLLPRTVTLSQNGNTVKSYVDSTGTIIDSIAAGTYTIVLNSLNMPCATVKTLTIADSGIYPYSPEMTNPVYYCKNDTPVMLVATPAPGATVHWYDMNDNALSAAPVPSTATPGIFSWLVNQTYNVCESIKDTVQVYVTEKPIADFSMPPFICTVDTALVTFTGSAGAPALYYWTWDNADSIIGSGAGPFNVHWDTAGVKTVSLQVIENQCPSLVKMETITVKATPKAMFTYQNVCLYDSSLIQFDTTAFTGSQFLWNYDGGTSDATTGVGPHLVHWPTSGTKNVWLQVSLDGCSDSTSHLVTVWPQPQVSILNKPETLCYGDKIYLQAQATGGSEIKYQWEPAINLSYDPDGALYTRVLVPTAYSVVATNEYNCIGTDTLRYTDIQPCCNFMYPDAFTPNGDNRNDRFHVLTYGNDLWYELDIYNRWGQKIFTSSNQYDEWDGTQNGKPCEMGVYYYYFKGKCMTGHEEEHKGEVTLIR
ncbi:gliding motility-associated C-terminal domain-containing protein [Taibaiella soli]|uniref:PKD domain-containing protein n=1 Tax=Taibaiella soli TaxID=1649169 RepID=A0A2W2AFW2_9BACT|nr:gliding motility-associated C-terminal domain-containing protein [Taibaiella soli]PZF74405.1 hypothetical protein DN068_02155 [Taibaiella soli]